MAKQRPFLDALSDTVLLFDGGMGTELYKRGVYINKCFEELNLANPGLVRQVHEDYRMTATTSSTVASGVRARKVR